MPNWRYEISFLLLKKKRYSISLVHSTKQTMMFYLFRKISSQYGTEMLQTKQPQQELGKFLCKFISKNHRISKSPTPSPPPNTKSPNLKWYSLLYIKLYYFEPLELCSVRILPLPNYNFFACDIMFHVDL